MSAQEHVTQPIVAQPVIKDVTTLKANLKEEKRARAEAEAERAASETPVTDAPAAEAEGEPRKRRKVSGAQAVGATAPTGEQVVPPVTSEDNAQDGPLPPAATAKAPEQAAEAPVAAAEGGAKPLPASEEKPEADKETNDDSVVKAAAKVVVETVTSTTEENGEHKVAPEVIEPEAQAEVVEPAAAS